MRRLTESLFYPALNYSPIFLDPPLCRPVQAIKACIGFKSVFMLHKPPLNDISQAVSFGDKSETCNGVTRTQCLWRLRIPGLLSFFLTQGSYFSLLRRLSASQFRAAAYLRLNGIKCHRQNHLEWGFSAAKRHRFPSVQLEASGAGFNHRQQLEIYQPFKSCPEMAERMMRECLFNRLAGKFLARRIKGTTEI